MGWILEIAIEDKWMVLFIIKVNVDVKVKWMGREKPWNLLAQFPRWNKYHGLK